MTLEIEKKITMNGKNILNKNVLGKNVPGKINVLGKNLIKSNDNGTKILKKKLNKIINIDKLLGIENTEKEKEKENAKPTISTTTIITEINTEENTKNDMHKMSVPRVRAPKPKPLWIPSPNTIIALDLFKTEFLKLNIKIGKNSSVPLQVCI